MKVFTLYIFFIFSNAVFAIDRFVDPNLSSGNGTTLFTNITSAISTAVNGDRIIIASNTYNETALIIGKSLQIMPQTAGTTINFNANITIAGFPGMKLEITGINLGIYSFNSNPITSGSTQSRSKISIINCSSEYLWFDNNFYEVSFIENQITKGIIFRYGNVVKNISKQISLMDEPNENSNTTERNLIIANQVQFLIGVFNNDFPIVVANNTMRDLSFRRWNKNPNLKNYIINNEFSNDCILHFSTNTAPQPYYNIIFSNNKFNNSFKMAQSSLSGFSNNPIEAKGYNEQPSQFNYDTWMPSWSPGWYSAGATTEPSKPNNYQVGGAIYEWIINGSDEYFNNSSQGFFEFSYNGILGNFSIPSSGSPLNLTNIAGPTNPLNGGNPNHAFYDIDLTINDRGINGGPYSQLNYNAVNPNNSKAFIFDLDMPSDLFPSQNVQIKAKGYHKN